MSSYLKKILIPAFFALFTAIPSQARHYPNGLEADSVDPNGDSIAIERVRHKMDSIRKAEHRPTVALVLCGGGAKGAAEVGAMKYLEEMQIPIDLVCGTSIGSLLGGLYSVGYDQAYLEELMRTADWEKLLSDKVDTKYISLYTKEYKARYPLAIPFHYSRKTSASHGVARESYKTTDGKLHIQEGEDELGTKEGLTSLAGSLPSGYVYGFNVNNLFSSLTVGYHDAMHFSDLPVPFCCVATDIVSCKAKNWNDGHLKQAMRSSMGIPGMFSSVRTGAMVLVDGGLRNNFPADLAKAMGVDYIIGIDISDKYADAGKVNNVGTVFYQFIDMMTRDTYELNLDKLDVHIRPNTVGYSSLSFSPDAVDTLIRRGYEAALHCREGLERIKKAVGGRSSRTSDKKAVNINETPVMVSGVEFDGLSQLDALYLKDRIKLDTTKALSGADIENAMSIIEASTAVETATYSLLGTEEPYRLVFSCTPAPSHRLGLAVRLDTECWAEIGINFGLNVNKLSGFKMDADFKLGISQAFKFRFMYDMPAFPAINIEVKLNNNNADRLYGTKAMESNVLFQQSKLYVSQNSRAQSFEFQAGLRHFYYKISQDRVSALDSAVCRGNYFGVYVTARLNTMDRMDFPSRGVDLRASYTYDFVKSGCPNYNPIGALALDFRSVVPIGERFAFVPDLHFRNVFDQNNEYYFYDGSINPAYSPLHRNFVGGDIQGRYFEQQIPFVGFGDYMAIYDESASEDSNFNDYNHIMVFNGEARFSPLKNLYFSALGGCIYSSTTLENFYTFKQTKWIWAAGLQAAYHTIVGPVKIRAAYSDRVRGGSFRDNFYCYLSAGFDF